MDVLTDVLETVRLTAVCYGRIELTAPWGLCFEPSEEIRFHVVLEGNCQLEVNGVEGAVALAAGDLVALPHGVEHRLRDAPGSATLPLQHVIGPDCYGHQATYRLGGGGPPATLVSGAFCFEHQHNNPLLQVLPPLVLLRGDTGRTVHWLQSTLQFIASEASEQRPGSRTVVNRLADVLFIQIVRGYLASAEAPEPGWLGALTEPQIGAAIKLVHQHPEDPWTVASLAHRVGMSRSAFASRFSRLVGEPPLQYLTRWRMQKAAGMLREGRATLAEIAERVGYESEAAFSKAFKRSIGSAPGAYRRAARTAA